MKDKKEEIRVMWKEAGILFAITLIAGILLGFVQELTKEPIRLQKEREVQDACRQVFSDAAQFQESQQTLPALLIQELAESGVEIGTIYEAFLQDGTLAGYVVESTSSEGYNGDITLYAGIRLDGTLNGISILEINETPGLGMNAEKVLVPQFSGKAVEEFTYTKSGSQSESEIDAISGATYTTDAVISAVNGALKAVRQLTDGGGANE